MKTPLCVSNIFRSNRIRNEKWRRLSTSVCNIIPKLGYIHQFDSQTAMRYLLSAQRRETLGQTLLNKLFPSCLFVSVIGLRIQVHGARALRKNWSDDSYDYGRTVTVPNATKTAKFQINLQVINFRNIFVNLLQIKSIMFYSMSGANRKNYLFTLSC